MTLKHKPVLMTKIQLKLKNEAKKVQCDSEQNREIAELTPVPTEVNKDPDSINDSSSFLLFLAQGFFRLIKNLFTKHFYILLLLYFVFRWLGLDIYPPFGDFVTSVVSKTWLLIQNYLKKELYYN